MKILTIIVIGICITGLITQLSYLVLTNIPHGTNISFKILSVSQGGLFLSAYILGWLTKKYIKTESDYRENYNTLDGHLTKNNES